MSENPPNEPDPQVTRMNRVARDNGGGSVDAPASPAGGDEPPKVPWVELPREGRLGGAFARELGALCSCNGVYRRDKIPVTINKETGMIEVISKEEFVGYIESLCMPFVSRKVKKVDDDGNESEAVRKVPKSMTVNTANVTLRHPDFVYRQRKLERVNPVRMPIMRADGRIELLQEGYDKESGIVTLPGGPAIKELGIEEAHAGLLDVLKEFPFADWDEKREASRSLSVQVASMVSFYGALLLPLNAARLGTLFNANSHGAGKTLLVKMIVTPVMGKTRLRAMPKNDEEFRKLLETAALSAAPCIVLDNVSGNLKNDDLDAFMTSEDWGGRRMHSQTEFEVPRQSIVYVTGHNLTISGDLGRRFLECKLAIEEADIRDHRVVRPINDQYLKMPEIRSQLLSCLWAIIRAWSVKRPSGSTMMGGFQDWCGVYGGMSELAGFGDPCQRPPDDESADSELEDMTTLIRSLATTLAAAADAPKKVEFKFSEVLEACVENNCFSWMIEGSWKDLKPEGKCYVPTGRTESSLGRLLAMKYGGRLFTLKDGRKVRFGKRGKNRHRRYELSLED